MRSAYAGPAAGPFLTIVSALALGVDPAVPDVLERLPRDPKAGVFNLWTGSIVLYQGRTTTSAV